MAIFKLNGPLRIDPGKTGLKKHSFAFVNTSGFPIHDLNITTFDDDLFGGSPDIVENGCGIETFTPQQQGGGLAVGPTKTLKKGKDWTRTNDGGDAEETKIDLEGDGIPVGGGVIITLEFDETLDGNEGITISPSRLLPDGTHSGIGGTETATPEPFTFSDLLEMLEKMSKVVPLGKIIGALPGGKKASFEDIAKADNQVAMAIENSLDKGFRSTRLRDFHKLPVHALKGITAERAEQLQCSNIGEFMERFEFDKLRFLSDISDSTKG